MVRHAEWQRFENSARVALLSSRTLGSVRVPETTSSSKAIWQMLAIFTCELGAGEVPQKSHRIHWSCSLILNSAPRSQRNVDRCNLRTRDLEKASDQTSCHSTWWHLVDRSTPRFENKDEEANRGLPLKTKCSWDRGKKSQSPWPLRLTSRSRHCCRLREGWDQ